MSMSSTEERVRALADASLVIEGRAVGEPLTGRNRPVGLAVPL